MKRPLCHFQFSANHALLFCFCALFLWFTLPLSAQSPGRAHQPTGTVVERIIQELDENSLLERLAHELLDVIGPRLVGTPQMDQAHEWAIKTFGEWGISAENQQFGEWRGWERGISHIDMIYPQVKTLSGMQLSWSPSTGGKSVEGEVVLLPEVADSTEFEEWLSTISGKFVLISMLQPTGRPEHNWKEFATEESFERMQEEKDLASKAWNARGV